MPENLQEGWSSVQLLGDTTDVFSLLSQSAPARLQVVLLPGNPGLAQYYEPFLRALHAALSGGADVFCISNAGHGRRGRPRDLEGQTLHKLHFLRQSILQPGKPPLVLMGHSIGAYIAVKLAQQLGAGTPGPSQPALSQVVALFPFFEVDPTSRKQRVLRTLAQVPRLCGVAAGLAGLLPRACTRALVRGYAGRGLAPHAVEATLSLLRYGTARAAFHLARSEFRDLTHGQGYDWRGLERLGAPLTMVCAPKDVWMPPAHVARVAELPAVDLRLPGEAFAHDFCVSEAQSSALAALLAPLVRAGPARLEAPRPAA